MRSILKVALCSLLLLATGACGGSRMKVNFPRVSSLKKVAIVGVCQLEKVVGSTGAGAAPIRVGDGLILGVANGFDAALPVAWRGVEIVTLATVSGNPSLPPHEAWKRRICAGERDPFLPKGFTGDPDKVYLREVAEKLGVDAVVLVTGNLGLKVVDHSVHAFSGSLNPVYVFIVDRNGEQLASISMSGLESPSVPESPETASFQDFTVLGPSYGQVIATELVKHLQQR